MNFLLFCDKKQKRELETVIQKTDNVTLLGTEVAIRPDFLEKVFEEYNPHGVVITADVRLECEQTPYSIATAIKLRRPSMRVIFLFGDITDKEQFDVFYNALTARMIYDIITNQPFSEVFSQLVKTPFTKSDLDESLTEKAYNEVDIVSEPKKDYNIVYDVSEKAMMNLNRESLRLNEFDMFLADTVSESEPERIDTECISIGVAALQKRSGCTHTAFELAALLVKNGKKVCVIMLDDTAFSRLTKFYGVPLTRAGGLSLQGISIFPKQGLEKAKEKYNYVIADLGVLPAAGSELFLTCIIKLVLCSPADWDLSVTMDYINSDASLPDVNYCFYPISRNKYIAINKRMQKTGLKAYRLYTSDELYQPCAENEKVYLDIFKRCAVGKLNAKKRSRK